LTFGETNSCL
jgi:hypothetical protein